MDNKRKNTENGKLHIADKNASPYRASQDGEKDRTRRGDVKNYGTRPVRQKPEKKPTKIIRLFPAATEADKHRKIERTRKKGRIKKQQIRAVLALVLALILSVILLFMTPLFNIKEIRLDGNKSVTKDIINTKVGDLIGANLFSTSISDIEERMAEIPQISGVEVKKAIFPSRLEMKIIESRPAGYVLCGKKTLIIDSDLKIIDDEGVFDREALPSISGVSVSEYELNEPLAIKSEEKKETLKELLKAFEATDIVDYIKYISIDDLTAITFNYDNRIDVLCGSQLQLERKIRLFAVSIGTSEFDENSIGTINLSVPGKAEYTP